MVSWEIQMNWLVDSSSFFFLYICVHLVSHRCVMKRVKKKRHEKNEKKNCVNNGVKKRIELEVLGVI